MVVRREEEGKKTIRDEAGRFCHKKEGKAREMFKKLGKGCPTWGWCSEEPRAR